MSHSSADSDPKGNGAIEAHRPSDVRNPAALTKALVAILRSPERRRIMKRPQFFPAAAVLAILCSASSLSALAQSSQAGAPDNSKQNQMQTQTADTQSNAKSDRMTTAQVRRALMADKNLSTYAHNVKIMTQNGEVTLKGPVKSDQEKQQVATDASSVVSPDHLANQLTVKQ